MKNDLIRASRAVALLATVLLAAGGAAHAQTYMNATVGGVLAPGVYGRIDIGNAPPPPVIYSEPIIYQRPAVVVPRSPIYLYVPPGHAKNWGKHCARYNACNQPVYFVQEPVRAKPYKGKHGDWDDDHHHGKKDKGRGKGHGRGHDD